jgi:hypothetical protein
MTLETIKSAASRARTLCTDLERSNRPEDRNQVAAGVRHELDTILRAAHSLQEAAVEAARGNRPGKVRSDAADTSRQAAQAITLKTGTARWAILERLFLSGQAGCTDWELQRHLDLNPSTERPRRGELVDAGLVDSLRGPLRTHEGREWTIWVLTQAGADAYRERIPGPPIVVEPTGQPTLF